MDDPNDVIHYVNDCYVLHVNDFNDDHYFNDGHDSHVVFNDYCDFSNVYEQFCLFVLIDVHYH